MGLAKLHVYQFAFEQLGLKKPITSLKTYENSAVLWVRLFLSVSSRRLQLKLRRLLAEKPERSECSNKRKAHILNAEFWVRWWRQILLQPRACLLYYNRQKITA